MTDYRTILERDLERVARPASFTFDDVSRRRDRKRRNQRIAAGVVGIAVFVAAIWFVTTGLPFDQSQTEVVPGGDVTGPAETGPMETRPTETGPAETGPTVTGPLTGDTGDPFSPRFFPGLPPEGATPSEPLHGELIASHTNAAYFEPFFYLYADGRLIWARICVGPLAPGKPWCPDYLHWDGREASAWIEQRLTPEGVELIRSGAVPLIGEYDHNPGEQLPVSAWEDPKLRPYVPQRYAITPSGDLSLLPAAARDLLPGTEERVPVTGEDGGGCDCFVVTIDDARALVEILSDAGYEPLQVGGPEGMILAPVVGVSPSNAEAVSIEAILPHGEIVGTIGW